MKVGDWVNLVRDDGIIFDTFQYDNDWNGKNGFSLELWQPKEGEWCWSKYDGLVQILKITDERYIVFPLSASEKDCTIEYRLGGLEPFIGELPSFIKDKQWKIIA